MAQLSHNEVLFTQRTFPVILVCDTITYQPNIGSLFRICEAFGVEKIIFSGKNLAFTPRKINRTSRSTHLKVPFEIIEETEDVVKYITENEYTVLALEITDNSTPLRQINIDAGKPLAIIAGSEVSGISPALLKTAQHTAHIDMYGSNSSMSVAQAVAIALYEVTGKIS